MKFALATFLSLASVSALNVNEDLPTKVLKIHEEATEFLSADTPVNINVDCTGLNMNKLSLANDVLVSHVLEDTYNKVHKDADDSQLTNVKFHANRFEENVGQGGGGWTGDYGCTLCKDDDGMMRFSSAGALHKAWEAELTSALLASGRESLAKVKSCSIQLSAALSDEEPLEDVVEEAIEFSSADTPVNINVDCTGLNMNKLSLANDVLVSHVLEDTYNKVHEDADDSQLTNVMFHADRFGKNVGRWSRGGGSWTGDYGCTLCKDDDGMMHFSSAGALHKAWETELTSALLASGRKSLAKVKSCSIQLSATFSDEEPLEDVVEEAIELSSDDTPVNINVDCTGLNMNKLSLANDVLVSHVLEDTYNKVHKDADDSQLTNVKFHADRFGKNVGRWSRGGGSWTGDYGCTLCKDDDGMMRFSSAGALHTPWETELTSALLASGRKSLAKVKSCSIQLSATFSDEEPLEDVVEEAIELSSDDTPVNINVDCTGLNMNKLSLANDVLVSHVLEDTYNKVHKDADDSQLTNVKFHANRFGKNVGRWSRGGGSWTGDYGCTLCKDDDGMMRFSSAGALHKAWETELTSALLASGRKSLAKVKSCSIQLSATLSDEEPLEDVVEEAIELLSTDTLVNINVDCNGITMSKLSLASDVLVGHVLEDSYNTIHEAADGDDSELTNVKFHANRFGKNVGQGGGGWTGDYGCNLCKDDDGMMRFSSAGALHKAWETELTSALLASGHKAFRNVKSCSINMSAAGDVSSKCGLRGGPACAEA